MTKSFTVTFEADGESEDAIDRDVKAYFRIENGTRNRINSTELRAFNLSGCPMNRLTPQERFQRDPAFAALVKVCEDLIHRGDATPTELREAVTLAETHYRMRNPPVIYKNPPRIVNTAVPLSHKEVW